MVYIWPKDVERQVCLSDSLTFPTWNWAFLKQPEYIWQNSVISEIDQTRKCKEFHYCMSDMSARPNSWHIWNIDIRKELVRTSKTREKVVVIVMIV